MAKQTLNYHKRPYKKKYFHVGLLRIKILIRHFIKFCDGPLGKW